MKRLERPEATKAIITQRLYCMYAEDYKSEEHVINIIIARALA